MFSNAAMRFTLAQAGRVAGPAQIQDWGTAQNYITNVLAMLYSSDVECNVIINAHIKYLEGESGGLKIAQVNTLGSSLPPQVGRYFNNMFWAGQVGMKRVIRTKASPTMALKSAAPGKVKDEYPLETGMAHYSEGNFKFPHQRGVFIVLFLSPLSVRRCPFMSSLHFMRE